MLGEHPKIMLRTFCAILFVYDELRSITFLALYSLLHPQP